MMQDRFGKVYMSFKSVEDIEGEKGRTFNGRRMAIETTNGNAEGILYEYDITVSDNNSVRVESYRFKYIDSKRAFSDKHSGMCILETLEPSIVRAGQIWVQVLDWNKSFDNYALHIDLINGTATMYDLLENPQLSFLVE